MTNPDVQVGRGGLVALRVDDLDIEVTLQDVDDRPGETRWRVTKLVATSTAGRPVTQRALGRIPLGWLEREAAFGVLAELLADRATGRPTLEDTVSLAAATQADAEFQAESTAHTTYLGRRPGAPLPHATAAGRVSRRKAQEAKTRRIDDVASRYMELVRLGERAPAKVIAEETGLTRRQVHHLIAEARQQDTGYGHVLPRGRRGAAG